MPDSISLKTKAGLTILYFAEFALKFAFYGTSVTIYYTLRIVDPSIGRLYFLLYEAIAFLLCIVGGLAAAKMTGKKAWQFTSGATLMSLGLITLSQDLSGTSHVIAMSLIALGFGLSGAPLKALLSEQPQERKQQNPKFTEVRLITGYVWTNAGALLGFVLFPYLTEKYNIGQNPHGGFSLSYLLGAAIIGSSAVSVGCGRISGLIREDFDATQHLAERPSAEHSELSTVNRIEQARDTRAFVMLMVFSTVFWTIYFLSYTTFVDQCEKLDFYLAKQLGLYWQAGWIRAVNPLSMIIFGVVFAILVERERKASEQRGTPNQSRPKPSLNTKHLGIAFLILPVICAIGLYVEYGITSGTGSDTFWHFGTSAMLAFSELLFVDAVLVRLTYALPPRWRSFSLSTFFVSIGLGYMCLAASNWLLADGGKSDFQLLLFLLIVSLLNILVFFSTSKVLHRAIKPTA